MELLLDVGDVHYDEDLIDFLNPWVGANLGSPPAPLVKVCSRSLITFKSSPRPAGYSFDWSNYNFYKLLVKKICPALFFLLILLLLSSALDDPRQGRADFQKLNLSCRSNWLSPGQSLDFLPLLDVCVRWDGEIWISSLGGRDSQHTFSRLIADIKKR